MENHNQSIVSRFQELYATHYGKELSDTEAEKILSAVGGLILLASGEREGSTPRSPP